LICDNMGMILRWAIAEELDKIEQEEYEMDQC